MFDSWLAYVSGGVTIIAFVMQLMGLFPRYKEAQKSAFFIGLGFLFGTVITSMSGAKIYLNISGSPLFILVFFIQVLAAALFFLLLISAILTEDGFKRYNEGMGITAIIFIVLLIAQAFINIHSIDYEELTAQESIIVARYSKNIGNYERAEHFYTSALSSLEKNSEPYSILENERKECVKAKLSPQLDIYPGNQQ